MNFMPKGKAVGATGGIGLAAVIIGILTQAGVEVTPLITYAITAGVTFLGAWLKSEANA